MGVCNSCVCGAGEVLQKGRDAKGVHNNGRSSRLRGRIIMECVEEGSPSVKKRFQLSVCKAMVDREAVEREVNGAIWVLTAGRAQLRHYFKGPMHEHGTGENYMVTRAARLVVRMLASWM